jgi:hypothetical protein
VATAVEMAVVNIEPNGSRNNKDYIKVFKYPQMNADKHR